MNTRRLLHAPTMVALTMLLLALYIYGYVEQIGENTRSISAYAVSTLQAE